ncbi:MAG: AsmA family protein [Verrucomicrobiia bacterium]
MKVIKILVVIFAVLAVVVAAGVFWVSRYLQSPEFKQFVLGAARTALGADVKINDINVSLFSGVSLQGVTVANPEGYPGQLFTADAFVLRYRLLPLLSRRGGIEIEEVSIQKPAIELVRGDKGQWNYEKLAARTEQPTPAGAPTKAPTTTKPSAKPSNFEISLSKLLLTDGNVMISEKTKALLAIMRINLSSSLTMAADKLSGSGQASIGTIDVANRLFVRQITSPLNVSADEIQLAPLSGKIAGGTVSGDIAVKVVGDLKYTVNLQVRDADIDTLLQEAHTKRVMNGKLQATVAFEGTGGLPTMVGNGRAEIVGGKLVEIPLLNQLSFLLQVPALKELKFDECRVEFSMSNNVMQTPVIRLISPEVQLTGKGSVNLEDYSLNHDMTLALAKGLLANVPKEVRAIFTERSDGYLILDFRVWGPYDSPKTDLQQRIVKGAAEQLLEKGLQKLLR